MDENAPENTTSPSEKRAVRSRWQVGLRGLALLVVAVAVWMAYFVDRREIPRLESRIAALRPISRELFVDDPRQIAVVKREGMWYDENRWEIYLPEGSYRLCLATRQVDDLSPGVRRPADPVSLAPVVKSMPIGAGRHQVDLDLNPEQGVWKIAVGLDRAGRVEVEEPKEWGPDTGSSGGSEVSASEQRPADRPLVLFRRRFMKPDGKVPKGPTDGVLVWIERTAGPP